MSDLTVKNDLRTIVKEAFGGDYKKLMALAKASAIQTIGTKTDMTPQEQKIVDANSDHLAVISLGNISGTAMIAFRNLAWGVFWGKNGEGKWSDITIPVIDQATGEILKEGDKPVVKRFEKFEEWWDFAVLRAKINQTADSTNFAAITILMRYLKNRPITIQITTVDKDGIQYVEDRIITVDDILALEEAKLEIIMSGVRSLLDKYAADKDNAHLTKVGTIIVDAQTLSRSELKKTLSAAGLRGTSVNTMPTYVSNAPDGKHVIYTIVANASQEKFLNGILDGRMDVHAVEVDDLQDVLSRAIKEGFPSSAPVVEPDSTTNGKVIDVSSRKK